MARVFRVSRARTALSVRAAAFYPHFLSACTVSLGICWKAGVAAEVIGLPECAINLAQACVYMALAPKSNASYMALNKAREEVRSGPARAVPNHLRDRHRPGSDGYGPYLYPHDYPVGWVDQRYLPEGLERGAFYEPSGRGWEQWRVEASGRDRSAD
jgi:putative ATPase